MSKSENNNLKTKLAELEKIVDWFESTDVDVELALKKYQEGLALIDQINKHLESAKVEVEKINKKFNVKK